MKPIHIVTLIIAIVIFEGKAQEEGEKEKEGAWGKEYILRISMGIKYTLNLGTSAYVQL